MSVYRVPFSAVVMVAVLASGCPEAELAAGLLPGDDTSGFQLGDTDTPPDTGEPPDEDGGAEPADSTLPDLGPNFEPGACDGAIPLSCGQAHAFDSDQLARFVFVPETDGPVLVELTEDWSWEENLDLLVFEHGPEGCVLDTPARDSRRHTLAASAGVPLWFAVEPWQGHHGAAELTVQCCTPDCEERVCGDDGCGGSCGACPTPQLCTTDGQCGTPVVTPAATLGCGDSWDGVLAGSSDAASLCGHDAPGPDVAVDVEAPAGPNPVVVSAVASLDGGQPARLAVLGGDGATTGCLTSAVHAVQFGLGPAQTRTLVLEALDGVPAEVHLDITCCTPDCSGRVCGDDGCGGTCGQCATGQHCRPHDGSCIAPEAVSDTCASAAVIPALGPGLRWSTVASLAEASETTALVAWVDGAEAPYPGCQDARALGAGGPDAHFVLPAVPTGWLEVRLTPLGAAPGAEVDLSTGPTQLVVTETCPGSAFSCVGAVDALLTPGWQPVVFDGSGPWHLVVEGHDPSENGVFRLELRAPE